MQKSEAIIRVTSHMEDAWLWWHNEFVVSSHTDLYLQVPLYLVFFFVFKDTFILVSGM